MAKATITTPQGIKIRLDGTPSEITKVLDDLEKKAASQPSSLKRAERKTGRTLLVDLIASLVDGNFFKKPKDLASIKNALAEMGHHYPVTTLSPTMLRLVRKKKLRRIREKNRWLYVQ